ncbi:ribosome-binding factor A [Candidatus Berkelbacteria bacterium RIFOXYA2_FULL_43_10]|uniref:Ribosome-binding factor A n=1 Tax=Candidatus Berkelbacteria bacterium RIFOXYA2_FULL_43_10 TaxID=1797472 RepID=A0A1F5EAU8_9BACT|nr:MAG: ribosome-binding factor A [Candidatus Berkelbacteria bacterium RIFOXYA2_FULL_43_10]
MVKTIKIDKSFKLIRINETIKRNLSQILVNHSRDNIVSIVRVETSSDLSQSKIYISALNYPDKILKHLNKLSSNIWRELADKIKIRRLPKLIFIVDNAINEIIITGLPEELIENKSDVGKSRIK